MLKTTIAEFLIRSVVMIFPKGKESLHLKMDLDIERSSQIAILVPHPDDEVIGCYYFIDKYGKHIPIDLIYVTDDSDKSLASERQYEACAATENLTINKRLYWSFPDGKLSSTRMELGFLLKDIGEQYDYILSPATNDLTPDHAVIAEEAFAVIPKYKLVWYRSTWLTFPVSSADFIVSGSEKGKRISLRCFRTQRKLALQNAVSVSIFEARRNGVGPVPIEAFQFASTERLDNVPVNVLSLKQLWRIWKWR